MRQTHGTTGIFQKVSPWGATPTAGALKSILDVYFPLLQKKTLPKPLLITIISDGEATDDPLLEKQIERTCLALDAASIPKNERHIGIALIQIGNEPGVATQLKRLDKGVTEEGKTLFTRDIVDATLWDIIKNDIIEGIIKALLGTITSNADAVER